MIKKKINLQLEEFKDQMKSNNNNYEQYLKDELSKHFEESFFER
jgi:uncharacterized membrane-anchored protein YhcB (DUF1043 family)